MTIITYIPPKTGNQILDDALFKLKNDLEALASEKTVSSKGRTSPSGISSGFVTSGTVVGNVPAESENRIRRGVVTASAAGLVTFTFAQIPPGVECFVSAVCNYTSGGYGIGIADYNTLTQTEIKILVDDVGTVRCGLIYY